MSSWSPRAVRFDLRATLEPYGKRVDVSLTITKEAVETIVDSVKIHPAFWLWEGAAMRKELTDALRREIETLAHDVAKRIAEEMIP